MKLRVGDKVKFLNESGGGIISKIISSKMVNVAIEDGFEIPTLISELITIETIDTSDKTSNESFNIKLSKDNYETENNYEERISPIGKYQAKGIFSAGVYIAFVPHDQKWLITGLLDIYIINHTEFDVLYSFFLNNESGEFSGIDYGSINAESKLLLETIKREEIEKWTTGIIQLLFHKDENTCVLAPLSSDFKIKPAKLYKEDNYKDSSFLEDKSFMISVVDISRQNPLYTIDNKKYKYNNVVKNEAKQVKPEIIIDKHKTGPREAVVDLHIGELVDDYSKMENSEMLNIQINYFTKCLESAIANNFLKVTFIHGVGSGILKTAIKAILKDYKGIEYQDASMAKFGLGATKILIRHNSSL